MVEPREMRGDRREEEEEARGEEETPMTSKLKLLEPDWTSLETLAQQCWARRRVDGKTVMALVFNGDPKIFTRDDNGDERELPAVYHC